MAKKKLLNKTERYDLNFDQFGRYQTISALIEANRTKAKLRILDVGGLDGHIADFLPHDEVTILDILPGDGENYIQGDALHMPFKDGAFDIVMSSDTLEHIGADNRVAFVAESWRVAHDMLIVAAPFDTPGTAAAELRADEVYKTLAGKSYLWLEEHIANGLPSVSQLEEWIAREKLPFLRLSNNPLDEWEALLSHFFILDNLDSPTGRENYRALTRAYNHYQVFTEARDDAYRQFYAIAKTKPKTPALPPQPEKIDVSSPVLLAATLAGYKDRLVREQQENERLRTALAASDARLHEITSSKAWQVAVKMRQTKAKVWPKR